MIRIPASLLCRWAIILPVFAPNISALAATVRTVALEGQQAPGLPSDVNFESFDPPVINAAGHTAFKGVLTDYPDAALWSEGTGSLALVARQGDPAPGAPTGTYYFSFDTPVLNAAGQIAFHAWLTSGRGVWSGSANNLRVVAQSGGQPPGVSDGRVFNAVGNVRLNDAGEIAFRATLTGGDYGIWSERAGGLVLVAQSGMHAPGTPSGTVYDIVEIPVLNGAGQTAFGARVPGPHFQGIWSEGSGTLELVAREEDQAPGTPSGVKYDNFGNNLPALNSAGQIAFRAILNGEGVDSLNDEGLWSGDTDNLRLVARSGDRAPGTPDGVYFGSHSPTLGAFWPVVLNARGQTAFWASLGGSVDDTNNTGIWSEGSGSLKLVARAGDRAPGTPDGVQFGRMTGIPAVPTLNAAGQVAFQARLAGMGIDDSNDLGIWATDVNDSLRLIAREGEQLEVAPSDFRTIRSLRYVTLVGGIGVGSGNEDGRPSGFNDRGQLAFMATFTDGSSGVFVSNLVAIPEPATITLIGFVLGAFIGLPRGVKKNTGGRK